MLVGIDERVCQLADDRERLDRGQGAALLEQDVEPLPLDRLLDDVLPASSPGEPEHGHDVVVLQAARLLHSSLDVGTNDAAIGPEPHADQGITAGIADLVGGSRPAGRDLVDQLVHPCRQFPHACLPVSRAGGATTPEPCEARRLSPNVM